MIEALIALLFGLLIGSLTGAASFTSQSGSSLVGTRAAAAPMRARSTSATSFSDMGPSATA